MDFSAAFSELQTGTVGISKFAEEAVQQAMAINLVGRWHPYGFVVYHFGSDSAGRKLRLHVWPIGMRQKQSPEWPIHNHPWSFTSIILYGCVREHRYGVIPQAHGEYCQYVVSYTDGSSMLTRTGSYVGAKCRVTEKLVAGQCYRLVPSEYHAVSVADDDYAATFVWSDPSATTDAFVLGDRDGQAQYEFVRKPIGLAASMSILQGLTKSCRG